jgi:hypothetical protein
MAMDDNALMVPGIGHLYFQEIADTDAVVPPPDPMAPDPLLWPEVGHTSREAPFNITHEGGEVTTHGTWQKPAARTSQTPLTRGVTFTLLQWDLLAFRMYYGAQGALDTDGYFMVPDNPDPITGALFARIDDGGYYVPIFMPRVQITRAADVEMDAENLSGHPVRAALLSRSGFPWQFKIKPKEPIPAPTP